LIPAIELCYKRVDQSLEGFDAMTNQKNSHRNLHRIALVLLLGMFTSLACGMSIDYGAACLQQVGAKLFVRSYETGGDVPTTSSGFFSEDGGLTWSSVLSPYPGNESDLNCSRSLPLQVSDPRDPSIRYRLLHGGVVERSIDKGQTWQREIDSLSLTEPEAAYCARSDQAYYAMASQNEPQDISIDPVTGNVIVARGQVGVVVRTPDGQWRNVSVGPYVYEPLNSAKVATLLSGELVLAVALPFLISGIVFLLVSGWRWRHVLIGLPAWLLWLLFVFLSPARSSLFFSARDSSPASFYYLPMFLALLWSISSVRWLYLFPRRALPLVGSCAIVSAFLFYAPYALWAWAKVPSYDTALVYALLLVVATIVITAYFLQRELDRIDLAQRLTESEPM
jgi:hypothetical protein